ncbi:hypothetical protein NDU88_001762 [Pleurodeles waltl]|uniref:ribonuclease H n=1 Tax=Pleurodeles waltl TaxID=8319 RepID=A0AAV7RDR9_PLEWA|nr:hypothetical protein NDU88_001762 [Pleurodeles waltl]
MSDSSVGETGAKGHSSPTGVKEEVKPAEEPAQQPTPQEEPRIRITPFFPRELGGRLRLFKRNWELLTSDAWVLQTVSGFHIEFWGTPVREVIPRPMMFSESDSNLIDAEVQELLLKGAICPALLHPRGFVSNLFLVEKKDKGFRPVINLCSFNKWVVYHHFKMEGIHLLLDILLQGDWMVRLDLKDAYLTVPIFPPHRRFLQFQWRQQIFEFTSLPFGLSSAPWCFTKLLKPVVEFLWSRGLRLIIYLDDILLMDQSKTHLISNANMTIALLQDLGFVINYQKSDLIPSQSMAFLGFLIDSQVATLSLPFQKITKIKKELRIVLRRDKISLRQLARVVGLLSSSIQAIFPGPLHYRALQRLKNHHLRRGMTYSERIALNSEARTEIQWWLDHMEAWNGRAIFGSSPDLVIESDASLQGWGARCGDLSFGGHWTPQELNLHINCLELLADSFAIKSLTRDRVSCVVLLWMDNVSAVQYINRLGGTRSRGLVELVKDFWHFCLAHQISVSAEYLPGIQNGTPGI